MMDLGNLVVICGPTASGKTRLAVDIATTLNGEVVSADSMQIYRGMDIGTAKPTDAERMAVPHHLIDCVDISEEYSVALYQKQARECIAEIQSRGKLPILCGGTGLYVSSVVYPMDFSAPAGDPMLRGELQAYASEHGNEALHTRLAEAAPHLAAKLHINDVKRIIRALESVIAGGDAAAEQNMLFNAQPCYHLAWIGLNPPRELLYQRIDARVLDMVENGLLQEVQRLAEQLPRDRIAFQGLGYKELFGVLDGKNTLEEAIETVQRRTRNYAKRQLTWFRRGRNIKWFSYDSNLEFESTKKAVLEYIRNCLHIDNQWAEG